MKKRTLDYIDKIEVNVENLPKNIQALSYLAEGMRLIASNVLSQEKTYQKENEGLVFSMSSNNNQQLSNLFNWFAINTVSYCRIVTLLKLMDKYQWKIEDLNKNSQNLKEESRKYLNRVIPEIFLWRNKIAAHPAITDPYKEDNISTLEFSIMPNIVYLDKRFFAGALNWGSQGQESELKQWSLTRVFEEELIPRFWPRAEFIER